MGRISGIHRFAAILTALPHCGAARPLQRAQLSADAAGVEHTSMTMSFQDQHTG